MNLFQISLRNIIFSIVLLPFIISVTGAAEAAPIVAAPQAAGAIQDAVARVNDREITATELKRVVDVLLATEPQAKLSPETLKKVTMNVLGSLISSELVYQAGMKLEIKDLDKQVRENIAQQKARLGGEVPFEKELNSKGLTEKELSEALRKEIVINNFIAKTIDAKIYVSEEECKKYYDQNIGKFTQLEQVRVSHILIPTNATMSANEKKNAREQAEQLRMDLLKGRDGFIELAKKYSSAPDSKFGGDLGYLTREQMPPSFGQAAFALQPGQVSEIVETRAGYDIIKMRDRRPAVITSFDQAKPQIEEYLKKQKRDLAVEEFVQKARSSSKVEVLLK